jgi:hypothetical protein
LNFRKGSTSRNGALDGKIAPGPDEFLRAGGGAYVNQDFKAWQQEQNDRALTSRPTGKAAVQKNPPSVFRSPRWVKEK